MIYKMYNSSTPVLEKIETVLINAGDEQFIKYMPKKPEPEKEKVFTNAQLNALIIDCADIEKNNGYVMIAGKHGVEVDLVKIIEQAIKDEWAKRQSE